jgi:hypothetical protein
MDLSRPFAASQTATFGEFQDFASDPPPEIGLEILAVGCEAEIPQVAFGDGVDLLERRLAGRAGFGFVAKDFNALWTPEIDFGVFHQPRTHVRAQTKTPSLLKGRGLVRLSRRKERGRNAG